MEIPPTIRAVAQLEVHQYQRQSEKSKIKTGTDAEMFQATDRRNFLTKLRLGCEASASLRDRLRFSLNLFEHGFGSLQCLLDVGANIFVSHHLFKFSLVNQLRRLFPCAAQYQSAFSSVQF